MPSDANAMTTKGNVVLYLDKEVVEKSKELGFNLSKTFENHLKQLMMQFSIVNSLNNFDSTENKGQVVGLPGFEPESIEPKSTSLDQASRQPRAVFGCREDNFD
jgi:Post-segregation antitoxin CcdA